MPRRKTLDAFGREFEQLLLRAHEALRGDTREFTVQFASPNVSASIRMRTYQYFAALRASTARPDLVTLCEGLSMRTAGAALVFFHNDDSVEAVQLREALGLQRGFADGQSAGGIVAPSGLSTNLYKLAEIRARK